MSGVREVGVEAVEEPRSSAPSGAPEAGREVRWSARRKEQVVLRLLRGESLDLLARETGQPATRGRRMRHAHPTTTRSSGCTASTKSCSASAQTSARTTSSSTGFAESFRYAGTKRTTSHVNWRMHHPISSRRSELTPKTSAPR